MKMTNAAQNSSGVLLITSSEGFPADWHHVGPKLRGRKLTGERWGIYFPGHLYSPSSEASSASGFPWLHPRKGFLLTESIPQPGPQGLGQELQEISPVVYSKPRGWKLSKGEITVVVLYIAPVLSGDLRAWGKQGFNHPPAMGRLAWKATPFLSPAATQVHYPRDFSWECQAPARSLAIWLLGLPGHCGHTSI